MIREDTAFNPYTEDPFQIESKLFSVQTDKKNKNVQKINSNSLHIPLVNITEINMVLNQNIEGGKLNSAPYKKILDIQGVYPRWMGIGNLSSSTESINSLFFLGDSELENNLNVAPGFPKVNLKSDELIISENFAKYFGLQDKVNVELFNPNAKLNMTFDILQWTGTKNTTVLENILFNETAPEEGDQTKAQGILESFGFDPNVTVKQFSEKTKISSLLEG
jgi:hypothetical protein